MHCIYYLKIKKYNIRDEISNPRQLSHSSESMPCDHNSYDFDGEIQLLKCKINVKRRNNL